MSKERYRRDDILQKRHIILRSLLESSTSFGVCVCTIQNLPHDTPLMCECDYVLGGAYD